MKIIINSLYGTIKTIKETDYLFKGRRKPRFLRMFLRKQYIKDNYTLSFKNKSISKRKLIKRTLNKDELFKEKRVLDFKDQKFKLDFEVREKINDRNTR